MREGERRVLRRERDGDREGGGSEGRECFKLRELEKKDRSLQREEKWRRIGEKFNK